MYYDIQSILTDGLLRQHEVDRVYPDHPAAQHSGKGYDYFQGHLTLSLAHERAVPGRRV
jgi:hypothetical protein